MRFSVELLPEHPVDELIDTIVLADELDFYACYGADETYHKDMWQIFAAAAARTKRIRLGPGVTHVILKEPTIIAQQVATLDELTAGRAELVFSIGNVAMLDQYHIQWRGTRPIDRLREAYHVMRTFLDEGVIDFEGDFYRYTGLFTAARPVQERVPIKIGAMRGPRAFELAGEIADGLYMACAYARSAVEYATAHLRAGAEKVGRDPSLLDVADTVLGAIGPSSRSAKEAARAVVAFYIPSMSRELFERHGIEFDSLRPILDAFAAGDVARALQLTSPELAERLSFAGTPEEWIERIESDIVGTGVEHLSVTLADPYLVRQWSGQTVQSVPDLGGQLRLLHERVMPTFA